MQTTIDVLNDVNDSLSELLGVLTNEKQECDNRIEEATNIVTDMLDTANGFLESDFGKLEALKEEAAENCRNYYEVHNGEQSDEATIAESKDNILNTGKQLYDLYKLFEEEESNQPF